MVMAGSPPPKELLVAVEDGRLQLPERPENAVALSRVKIVPQLRDDVEALMSLTLGGTPCYAW